MAKRDARAVAETANIGLTEDQTDRVCEVLAHDLADLYVLYTKTLNYHWNVVGPDFKELHVLLEEQYEELEDAIDETAERIRQIGRPVPATLAEFSRLARLKEHPGEYPDAPTMLANLLADHEAVIRQLRNDVDTTADELHDLGTSDFLTGLMEKHEKMAWMLRAYTER
jgi:starvation-inducible DNA-binding protein